MYISRFNVYVIYMDVVLCNKYKKVIIWIENTIKQLISNFLHICLYFRIRNNGGKQEKGISNVRNNILKS